MLGSVSHPPMEVLPHWRKSWTSSVLLHWGQNLRNVRLGEQTVCSLQALPRGKAY